ncbi:MAG: nickel pincer cofactor biosynthesis protein LarB [Clostridiales bacterium]|jgi:NCAIR mutase (PurE)-related protein|nr:nickel pincer cofactor biosynthesis protein LarB [Clostridiales bacterium]
MNGQQLLHLLQQISRRELEPEAALEQLKYFDQEDLGFAVIDHHRELRKGFPEVIYGAGKTPEQTLKIMERLFKHSQGNIMATRCCQETWQLVSEALPLAQYHQEAKMITLRRQPSPEWGRVLVACAGTSDLPVAEEAALTAQMLGSQTDRLYDVGVAGIHRLFSAMDRLVAANVIVVVAGMEGALPSVIGGLVDKPVIAVPTSIGYGASFKGLAALLGMLNSCSSGVTVVNIDNGFGAGYAAANINRLIAEAGAGTKLSNSEKNPC